MRIVLATNNPHKLSEVREIVRPWNLEVLSLIDAGQRLDVEETGATYTANATLKAQALAGRSALPLLADDSGLEVDALGGRPGVRSARYGGPEQDDAGRVALLLEEMRGVPHDRRSARFVCAVACLLPGQGIRVVQRFVPGRVTHNARGSDGFGYDPVFFFPPFGRTFAELSRAEKASVSHRGQAFRALARDLLGFCQDGILSGWERAQEAR